MTTETNVKQRMPGDTLNSAAVSDLDWDIPAVLARMELKNDAPLAQRTARLIDRGPHLRQFFPVETEVEGNWISSPDKTCYFSADKTVQHLVRVYAVVGHRTEIVVLENELSDIEAVRKYRRELESGKADAPSAAVDPEIRGRALPEDFIPVLDSLPDSSMLDSLYLTMRAADPDDPGSTFCSSVNAGNTGVNGWTMFYRKDLDEKLAAALCGEWTWHYGDHSGRELRVYELASEFEKGGYYAREDAKASAEEDRNVHLGECFLHPNFAPFQEFARHAPVRAAVIAGSLGRLLDAGKGPVSSAAREALTLRIRYVNEIVKPRAISDLASAVETAPEEKPQQLAAKLLVHLAEAKRVAECRSLRFLDLSDSVCEDPDMPIIRLSRCDDEGWNLDLEGLSWGRTRLLRNDDGAWDANFLKEFSMKKVILNTSAAGEREYERKRVDSFVQYLQELLPECTIVSENR